MGSCESGWKESEKLLQAASNGDAEEISDLIANGTDISLKVGLGVSVEWFTAYFCHLIYLPQTFNLETRQDEAGRTALHFACDRGQTAAARLLIEKGAHIDELDEDGLTALHYAAACEHPDLVRILLHSGADVNIKDNDGNTPKMIADSPLIISLLS